MNKLDCLLKDKNRFKLDWEDRGYLECYIETEGHTLYVTQYTLKDEIPKEPLSLRFWNWVSSDLAIPGEGIFLPLLLAGELKAFTYIAPVNLSEDYYSISEGLDVPEDYQQPVPDNS